MSFRILLTALCAVAVGACDNLGLSGEPEELSVSVQAVGANQVNLITSTNWIFTNDPGCDPTQQPCPDVLRVLAADTTTVAAPLSQTYRFTRDFRYLIEVFPAGGITATIRMDISIDGKSWYSESRELKPKGANGSQETLQFIYQWQQPTIQ